MYPAQAAPSRTSAPRSVYRLWSVAVQFSATHRALYFGIQVFISAGASVPGVSWNSSSTPSMVIFSPVFVISKVGAMKDTVPVDWPMPMPWASLPSGPGVRRTPYW